MDDLTGLALRERQAFAPTSNIAGLLSGYTGEGVKTVLPASAMAKMDFRLVPDQEPQDIYAKLRAYLDAQGYTGVRSKASASTRRQAALGRTGAAPECASRAVPRTSNCT